jgi:hypothetical protein
MEKLTFLQTSSVPGFKKAMGIESIDIILNPKTNKVFFVSPDDSTVSGKVSESLDKDKEMSISRCKDDAGVEFYMLHNTAKNNVQFSL